MDGDEGRLPIGLIPAPVRVRPRAISSFLHLDLIALPDSVEHTDESVDDLASPEKHECLACEENFYLMSQFHGGRVLLMRLIIRIITLATMEIVFMTMANSWTATEIYILLLFLAVLNLFAYSDNQASTLTYGGPE